MATMQSGEDLHESKMELFAQNKVEDTVHASWSVKNENSTTPHVNTNVPIVQESKISERLLVRKYSTER